MASNPAIPLTISFDRLTCIRETSELGSDDPYVLFCVSDLAVPLAIQTPTLVNITDTFSMGEGDTRRQGDGQRGNRRRLGLLWGLRGRAAPIARPDDILVLVALIESDGGPRVALSVRSVVQSVMAANVMWYQNAQLPRAEMIRRLRDDLRGAITSGGAVGLPIGEDECIGTAEFRMTRQRLDVARTRGFTGAVELGGGRFDQGAHYRAFLKVKRGKI